MSATKPGPPDPLGKWAQPIRTKEKERALAAKLSIHFRKHPNTEDPAIWEASAEAFPLLKVQGESQEQAEQKLREELAGHLVYIGQELDGSTERVAAILEQLPQEAQADFRHYQERLESDEPISTSTRSLRAIDRQFDIILGYVQVMQNPAVNSDAGSREEYLRAIHEAATAGRQLCSKGWASVS